MTEPPPPTRLPGPPGAPVLFTFPGSPAEAAGVRAGDIITEMDGAAVGDPDRLAVLLDQHKPGARIALTIWRPEGTVSVALELGAMADQPARAFSGLKLLYDKTWDPYAAGRREVAALGQLGQTGVEGDGPGQFRYPRALAVGKDDGTFVATWGTRGTGPTQFLSPTGIAVGPDGRVYVADGDAHRVLIFPPIE